MSHDLRKRRSAGFSKAVSLFAGCGGFCEGMSLAGFEIQAAVELDRFAAATYRHNFGSHHLFEGDVRDFLRSDASPTVESLSGTDVVFGGPPCQGYSQIGTRDVNDARNDLYREFARVVRTLQPKMFLMENVPNLVLFQRGHYRDLILKKLRSIGYSNTTYVQVRASDYGVPQHRNRVVFIGTRDDLPLGFDLRTLAESALGPLQQTAAVTVWEAIGDLPKKVTDSGKTLPYPVRTKYSDYQKLMRLDFDFGPYTKVAKIARGIGKGDIRLHNQHTKEIQARRLHLISLLKPGQKANSLPKSIWNGTRPEKWRRLDPEAPAYTVLANMHRDLSEFVHPKLNRWITVREAARLQSFHDGFVFVGSEWQQLKQIGNAVPPLMGLALGRLANHCLAALNGQVRPGEFSEVQSVLPLLALPVSFAV